MFFRISSQKNLKNIFWRTSWPKIVEWLLKSGVFHHWLFSYCFLWQGVIVFKTKQAVLFLYRYQDFIPAKGMVTCLFRFLICWHWWKARLITNEKFKKFFEGHPVQKSGVFKNILNIFGRISPPKMLHSLKYFNSELVFFEEYINY